VLFRPEEIHGASGIGYVFEPLPEGYGYIGQNLRGFDIEELTIPYFHPNRESTIQAGGFDLNGFSGKEPADC
jgi:hypothetical protein